MTEKTADQLVQGDIIVTQDQSEHLVLRVIHKADATRLRTVEIATGKPKTRVWRHTREYTVDTVFSGLLAA